MNTEVTREQAEEYLENLEKDASGSGYHINPQREDALALAEGLLANEKRYGYGLCPCRITEGGREDDLDVICPCDYRDADLEEYDNCYWGLYVSRRVLDGEAEVRQIPERRPGKDAREKPAVSRLAGGGSDGIEVWRCRVCGYLCARGSPPETCPICKADRLRFEEFPL